jgi:peptide deformylase
MVQGPSAIYLGHELAHLNGVLLPDEATEATVGFNGVPL